MYCLIRENNVDQSMSSLIDSIIKDRWPRDTPKIDARTGPSNGAITIAPMITATLSSIIPRAATTAEVWNDNAYGVIGPNPDPLSGGIRFWCFALQPPQTHKANGNNRENDPIDEIPSHMVERIA